jgi:pimeloyl-ACP methyl ester carboxylesterase
VPQALKPATSQFVDVRGMRQHVLTWGDPGAPSLFMLHGWMDVAASFQFLVDALASDWHVVAPDLRGFGRSQWQPQGYWYWDYLADLDALLVHFAPDEPVCLVGHSLGGNVVMHYAGVRPERVRAVVSLDGFGIPFETPDAGPAKLVRWLDALREPAVFRPYANLAAVADRLQKTNPRLARDKAQFLARHWARELPDGTAELTSDPRHKLPFPTTYRMEEVYAVWRRIAAPVLWVAGAQSEITQWLHPQPGAQTPAADLAGVRSRIAHVPHARLAVVEDAGHMLHHDQPQAVAREVEAFLQSLA